MADIVARASEDARFAVVLMTAFAGTALLLALAGLYGTVAFTVTLRTPEIGVRLALGSTRGGVVRLALLEGLRPAGIGMAMGLAMAWVSMAFLESLLFGIGSRDVSTYAAIAVVVAVVATLACAVPAARAASVNPRSALNAG